MEIDLHVTNRCTLRCQHCVYCSGELQMGDMTLTHVKKISPDFAKLGVDEVHITGGEPLLNPEILDIIEHLRHEGYPVRLQTNGMLLNETVVQQLKNLGVCSILISLDGMKNTHNTFRRSSVSFDSAISAARLCLSEGMFTRINTVLHKQNRNEIAEVLQLTSQLGVQEHSFFYLTPIGRGKNLVHNMLSLEGWIEIQGLILDIAQKLNITDKVKTQNVVQGKSESQKDSDLCRRDNCLILANGDVFSCVFFVHSEYKLGNIHEKDLHEIWTDPQAWQNMSRNSDCNGGCPGLAYLLTGSPSVCDPRCCPDKGLFSGCIRKYKKDEMS